MQINLRLRIYQAKKLCPELICIKARHNLYVEYHHKIFNEVDRYLHVDHIFSIDEGACRLTGKYCLEEEAVSIAKIIKKAIRDNVGDYITSSIGIAPNRYLAKIASNMQKPDGLSVINPSELPNKLYSLNLKSLPGIGSKTEERLIKNGITSIKQLCFLDRARLKALWGNVWGEKVWSLIRGADLPLEETRNSTIGHSKVLGSEQQHIQHARNVLINLVQKAASRLRAKELYTTCILLTVGLKSGNSIKESLKIE
ncbi:MAG: DNA-directed DNA polymerase [Candidatus Megaira endosymbiont of Carteria cerasiformis]|nr:helix-hairpin-helix domain-containing protein [Candidatus Megaera polyxenophila]MCC8460998.1 DNA-directed DNA polymerase [Candidatus Megaera polyxenophila]